jgi:lipopolysaccharide transport system permease protein
MSRVIINAKNNSGISGLKELFKYRDLLYFFVLRSIKAKYAQSILGIGWAIIQPLIQTVIFTLIFGSLVKVESDGMPYLLFSFVAMVPWTYFSNILEESTSSLVQNRQIITKIYFPRIILPISAVFSKLLDFIIGMCVMVILFINYEITPGIGILIFPLLMLILLMTSLGAGMIFSALSIQYRDINYAMSFLIRILMYSAPVVYSISVIPEEYYFYYSLNPMVGVIEGLRASLLNTKPIPWDLIINGSVVSSIMFITGTLYFKKMEKYFADIA